MNDAIFKFKRYEDASLTYTGIDRHADEEVGDWDTTIRKTQYEKLFYNQQSSMTEVDYSSYATHHDTRKEERKEARQTDRNEKPASVSQSAEKKPIVNPQPTQPQPEVVHKETDNKEPDMEAKLEAITTGSTVLHKKFGKGTVVRLNRNDRFIHIKFLLGEKKFLFPDAFLDGFLEVK